MKTAGAIAKTRFGMATGRSDARFTHRVSRISIVWEDGRPAAMRATWLCGGTARDARLLHDLAAGLPLCRRCHLAEVDNGSVVYFAERGGLIKIGTSRQPLRRVAALKAALLAVSPGNHFDEWLTHDRFATDRVGGEWFRPSIALRSYIAALVVAA